MSTEHAPNPSSPPLPDPTGGRRIFDLSPLNLSPEQAQMIEKGRNAFLFGAFMDPMIEAGLRHFSDGSMKKDDVSLALQTVANLFAASGRDYEAQPNHLEDEEAIATHQENVKNGRIILVQDTFEMDSVNRVKQLKLADMTFSSLTPNIQAIIAELNYEEFFRSQTMAGGDKTRDRGERDRLISSLGKDQEAMPHLTLPNWSIGDITQGIVKAAQEKGKKVRIIDTGSGPGGTLSAETSRLNEAKPDRSRLAITGIETTQGFYDQLGDFVSNDPVIEELGLEVNPLGTDAEGEPSKMGNLTIIKSDTLSGLKRIHDQGFSDDEVVVITGNYSWHRLDSKRKQEIMELYKDVPNVVFLIGDFANHGNPAAKQYFCLGANGPLNVGNIDLSFQFWKSDYSLVDLEEETPGTLDPRFRERIVQDHNDPNSDGHLWIAYRGELARESLQLKAA